MGDGQDPGVRTLQERFLKREQFALVSAPANEGDTGLIDNQLQGVPGSGICDTTNRTTDK